MAVRARLTAPPAAQPDWAWHTVKSASLPASMLFSGYRRMEAENYLASGFSTRLLIEAKESGWSRLADFARIWQPGRLKGIVVPRDAGTPYIAATQVYDHLPSPRRWLAPDKTSNRDDLYVDRDTILITRSGSVGRATIAGATLNGAIVSDDLLRLLPKMEQDWGWLYAYLRAPTVRSMMSSAQYGHIIKHLEVSHLQELPLIKVDKEKTKHFNKLVREVTSSRSAAFQLVKSAEADYEKAVGTLDIRKVSTAGFTVSASGMFRSNRRLEAHYFNPFAQAAESCISSARKVEKLSELVDDIFIPGRFKHVYGPEGTPYLDSAQILEAAPDIEKHVLSLVDEKKAGYLVDRGTLLLPCSGQLHGIIGSVVLAGAWHENKVLTNHILRIMPRSNAPIRIGYLQAVLAHPMLGRPRVLRGAFGSSVPELSVDDIREMSIPRLASATESKIADAMEEAAALWAHANEIEDQIAADAEVVVRQYLATK